MTQLERSLLPNFSVPSAPVQVLVHLLQAFGALQEVAVSLLHCGRRCMQQWVWHLPNKELFQTETQLLCKPMLCH